MAQIRGYTLGHRISNVTRRFDHFVRLIHCEASQKAHPVHSVDPDHSRSNFGAPHPTVRGTCVRNLSVLASTQFLRRTFPRPQSSSIHSRHVASGSPLRSGRPLETGLWDISECPRRTKGAGRRFGYPRLAWPLCQGGAS